MSRSLAFAALACLALSAGPSSAWAKAAPAPKPRIHRVYPGQHLRMIAKRYNVTVEALAHANDLDPGEPLLPGQRLYIPPRDDTDGSQTQELVHGLATASGPSGGKAGHGDGSGAKDWRRWAAPPSRRGFVELRSHEQTWRGTVVSKAGKVLPAARNAFSRMLANADGDTIDIDPQLMRLVAKVSDTFGGRPIQVVSGYRLESYAWQSRHKTGHAVDFAIPGVPNAAVRDFVRTFPKVGVGFYPNSHFVHLDVREQWTYWVDNSGPGEPPRYAGFWTHPVGR
jgi:LysM repeat protein